MITGLMQSVFTNMAAAAAVIPIHPTSASSIADSVDHLYYFLTAITLFFTFGIFTIIFYFMVRFRRRSPDERPADTKTHMALEITWTLVPTLITVGDFRLGFQPLFRKFATA